MKITIISCFRNATAHIPRYFDQMGALSALLARRGDWLKLILGYGDSTDGTGEMLHEEATFSMDALLVDVSHGGPAFGSIEHPQRFKQLAAMGNKLLGYVPNDTDVVGIVESDLIWEAQSILQLLEDLEHVPCVSGMIMDGPNSFYDVFAARRNGQRFTKTPPYHPDITPDSDLLEVDSAGSVLFMDAELARKARFTDGEAIVGYCRQIRDAGGTIWINTQVSFAHYPYGGRIQHQSDSSRAPESVRL